MRHIVSQFAYSKRKQVRNTKRKEPYSLAYAFCIIHSCWHKSYLYIGGSKLLKFLFLRHFTGTAEALTCQNQDPEDPHPRVTTYDLWYAEEGPTGPRKCWHPLPNSFWSNPEPEWQYCWGRDTAAVVMPGRNHGNPRVGWELAVEN